MKIGQIVFPLVVLTAVVAANPVMVKGQMSNRLLVSLNLSPNPPAEIAEWASGKGEAIVTLISENTVPIDVNVAVTVSRNDQTVGGVGRDLRIEPGVRILTWQDFGAGVLDGYDSGSVHYTAVTNRLPPGIYRCCVRLTVPNTVTLVGLDTCATFTISSLYPSRLQFPANNSRFHRDERPQFQWTPTISGVELVRYRFVVAKVNRDQGQTPTNAFRGNQPICDMIVPSTSLFWPSTLPLPDTGLYVWSVQGINAAGKPLGGVGSWNELFLFSVEDKKNSSLAPDVLGDSEPSLLKGKGAQSTAGQQVEPFTLLKPYFPKPGGSPQSEPDPDNAQELQDTIPFLFRNIRDEGVKGTRQFRSQAQILDHRDIEVDSRMIRVGSPVQAEFFDDTIQISITKMQQLKKGVVWIGNVVGEEDSHIIFVAAREGDTVIGNIYRGDDLYHVRYYGNSVHKLLKINQKLFTREADPLPPPNDIPPLLDGDYPTTDPPDRIDLMVLYTPEAQKEGGGRTLMELDIALAVAEANFAYENSGLAHRLELVHTAPIPYMESGKLNDDLNWLRSNSDVRRLRDQHAADIVMLVVEKTSGNMVGLGEIMPVLHPWSERFGFGVVQRMSATIRQTFGHEIGHIMGCQHTCEGDLGEPPLFPYAYGYLDSLGRWGTIMVPLSRDVRRLPLYSNPAILYGGRPAGRIGEDCSACEVCVMERTAPIVANYRSRLPLQRNVMMKDTWNDDGTEPGRLDSVGCPWGTPWVEMRQDTGVSFDIRRLIPDPGKPRWVSVTLRNGGRDTARGVLQLYYRQASLTTEWDSSWTLFSSTPQILPPEGGIKVRTLWEQVPASVHYSIVARWESSSDTMFAPEGANLLDNVLNNNNIVWKNEYVLPIIPPTQNDPRVIAASRVSVPIPFRRVDGSTIEVICAKATINKETFLQQAMGTVQVEFDPASARLLEESGSVTNAESAEWESFRITDIRGGAFHFKAGDGELGTMTITFRPGFASSQAKYPVHIIQRSSNGTIIGGISYLLVYPDDDIHKGQSAGVVADNSAGVNGPERQPDNGASDEDSSRSAVFLFVDGYTEWDAPQPRFDPLSVRVLLKPAMRFGNWFSAPPMIAFTARLSNGTLSAPEQSGSSVRQFLTSPANIFRLSPRFGIVELNIGSQTPELSGLVGSSVQLFGLGVNVSPGHFRADLSAGFASTTTVLSSDASSADVVRGTVAGRLIWEKERGKIGLNFLYAVDGATEEKKDTIRYRTFKGTAAGALPLLVTADWNSSYQPGDHLPYNGKFYTVLDDNTLVDGEGGSLVRVHDSVVVVDTAVPPQRNLALSLQGKLKLNDAISIEAEGGGSLFTSDTRLAEKMIADVAVVDGIFPLNIATSLGFAGRCNVLVNRENSKSWNLEVAAEYISPGYLSPGLPYLGADRFQVTAFPGVTLVEGYLRLNGVLGWRRNNLNGMELATRQEFNSAIDFAWRTVAPFSISGGYGVSSAEIPLGIYKSFAAKQTKIAAGVTSINHTLRLAPGYTIKGRTNEQYLYGVASLSWGGERIDTAAGTPDVITGRGELNLTGFYSFVVQERVSADLSLTYIKSFAGSDPLIVDAAIPTVSRQSMQSGRIGLEYKVLRGRLVPRLTVAVSRYALWSSGSADVQFVLGGRVGWKENKRLEIAGWWELNDYNSGAVIGNGFTELRGGLEVRWRY